MSGKKIALFANDYVGLEICKFLVSCGEKIVKLYIHNPAGQKLTEEIIAASGCQKSDIILAAETNDPNRVVELKKASPDFIITVYWAHILKPEVFNLAGQGTINFHPALLPVNRGWYPHVHSILDGSPNGVTLHSLEETADTGPIWAQKSVQLFVTDTAKDIYERLREEIILMFKENWPKIKQGKIKPVAQKSTGGNYHKKSEVDELDHIKLDKKTTSKDLINLLRARTFGERGFSYFLDPDGKKVFLNLRLSRTGNFNKRKVNND